MLSQNIIISPEGLRAVINDAYRINELHCVTQLIDYAQLSSRITDSIRTLATRLMEQVRIGRKKTTGIDSFLIEYSLSSDEGIALMCLAEALLRIPDKATIDYLIKDKLAHPDWSSHKNKSDSLFVNATTWALMLTGKVLTLEKAGTVLTNALTTWINRSGEAVVRASVDKAMRIMSKQFVTGQTIHEALHRAKKKEVKGYRYSYDMLGEAALTTIDSNRYFEAYTQAIHAIGLSAIQESNIYQKPGISIKLSALHPRYQDNHRIQVLKELVPKLLSLAQLCKQYNIGLTVDAEESERLDLSLDVIESVFKDDSLQGWNGFGLAVQSYQKRAFYLLDWIADLARAHHRRIMVRLIKGAYWDSEIKKTQMMGFSDYPVFTRKVFTDLSFQACAKKLLTLTDAIYPQFATHNAYSVAMIIRLAGEYRDFEFQCLHGMGNELYEQVVPKNKLGIACRIYAPVGSHEDLLPYLVRRLLENGANSSFVNRIVDDNTPISELIEDPVLKSKSLLEKINQNIPLPRDIFLPGRQNSFAMDLSDRQVIAQLQSKLKDLEPVQWIATPIIVNRPLLNQIPIPVYSPQNPNQIIGQITETCLSEIDLALNQALLAFDSWAKTTVNIRVKWLHGFADLLEENITTLLAMICFEAGKTWNDGMAEIREAIDFCRYYAVQAEELMSAPIRLNGYTGEVNELSYHPRGLVLCISPWNFPLAIFTGQVVAALVTGNVVIAKPAEQTPIIAHFVVELMFKSGLPQGVIQLLPGKGDTVGAALVADQRIKAVIFTGSTDTANVINRSLSTRGGEIIPFIAETGGQNAMIVDSSALLEQAVMDVIQSAFGSAGQRCSALRVLFIQHDIYPQMILLLKGAMSELKIGDPRWLTTDIGPVIDQQALSRLENHVNTMINQFELIYQCQLTDEAQVGYFMPPTVIAIDSMNALDKEVFGPILHVISFKHNEIDSVIEQINSSRFGLTLGIHSRINQTVDYIRQRIHVGNCYVNRNMIGAVVGLQPFGGEGLSGTGPKAGGPNYLPRLCHERIYTRDTTAAGGNASLMSLSE